MVQLVKIISLLKLVDHCLFQILPIMYFTLFSIKTYTSLDTSLITKRAIDQVLFSFDYNLGSKDAAIESLVFSKPMLQRIAPKLLVALKA